MNYLIFASMALMTIASILEINRVGREPALSVSLHVAKTLTTIRLFRVLFGAATICFGLWAYFWLFQNVTLGVVGSIAFIGIVICFAGAALFPHIPGTPGGELHNTLAWGLVYLFPVAVGGILIANPDPVVRVAGEVTLAALLILFGGYILARSQRDYFLYYQMGFVAVFFGYMTMLSLYVYDE